MLLKALKILTIISYCLIQISGEHLGGPLLLFLILGLTNKSLLIILGSTLILFALVIILLTIIKPFFITDKLTVPISLFIISIPIANEFLEIMDNSRWISTRPFQFSTSLFFILTISLLTLTFRQNNTSNKEINGKSINWKLFIF